MATEQEFLLELSALLRKYRVEIDITMFDVMVAVFYDQEGRVLDELELGYELTGREDTNGTWKRILEQRSPQ